MDDCEEADFHGSCVALGKGKPKKNSGKARQDQVTLKKDASQKKKKRKDSTCKDTLGRKKEKKKDKKKKRKISTDRKSDVMTQLKHAQVDPAMIYTTPSLYRRWDQDEKPKRKKKVAFDLSSSYIRVKRPQFASSSRPKDGVAHNKTMEDLARSTQENNSPCNSEDINSQDLFITQKTFRALSPEGSSGDACTATTSAHVPMQQSIKKEKCEPVVSTTCLYGQRQPWKSQLTECSTEEKTRMKKTGCSYRNGGNCSQVKVELQAGLSKPERISAQPPVNRSSAEATVVTASESWASSQQISAFTQTENFFTSELTSYLSFVRKVSARSADLKPLDLSLPQKARKDPRTTAAISLLSSQTGGNGCENPEVESRCSLKGKEGKKDLSVGCVVKANPSLCSESGQKSADTTASSGEEQPSRAKLDLTQVKLQET